ncbi:hypothetical protein [Geminisphaera colitermitum]|uniref:hypothetical protein n=1 Tax=Geminisphaera colitermitum TaxID=1148786 RepID=UPI0001964F1D|nr:hypothetical protein [Geminisphaera colitermitum]
MTRHINRNYFPTTEKEQREWGLNFVTELPNFKTTLGISNDAFDQLHATWGTWVATETWQNNAQIIARERTADKERAAWAPMGAELFVRPNTTPTGPTANQSLPNGGFFTQAFTLIDGFIDNVKCTDDIKRALRLTPLGKSSPDPATVQSHVRAQFDGNLQRFVASIPAPAKALVVHCDYHDDQGSVLVLSTAEAHITDPRPAPADREEQRDYTFRLIGKDGQPIGAETRLTLFLRQGRTQS